MSSIVFAFRPYEAPDPSKGTFNFEQRSEVCLVMCGYIGLLSDRFGSYAIDIQTLEMAAVCCIISFFLSIVFVLVINGFAYQVIVLAVILFVVTSILFTIIFMVTG